MKRHRTIGWLAAAALSAVTMNTAVAQPLPFYDGFDDGNLSGWEVVTDPEPQSGPATWIVRNRVLMQTSNIWSYGPVELETKYHLGTHLGTGAQDWEDYSVNVVARSTDNDGLGLLVRRQDGKNYYRVLLMNDPAWPGLDVSGNPIDGTIQRIQRFDDGEPITLAENIVDQAYPSEWFSLTADVRGDTIRAYLDAELILEAVDGTYQTGNIGLHSYANTGVHYDSVLVSADRVVYERPEIEISYPVLEDRAPYVQRPTQNSIDIAWRSVTPFVGKVLYGSEKGALSQEVVEDSATQKHIVTMDGLEPSTRYYYEVYNGTVRILNEQDTRTARRDDETRFSFFVLGDSGVDTPTQWDVGRQMLSEMNRSEVDFIVHVGDVHQGSGDYYDDVYFKPYGDLIKKINVFTSLGNHDTYTDNGAVYLDDFYLPHNNPQQTERYYSFRWANAFFICLDTNIDYSPGSDQYEWFVDQLEDRRRLDAKWTFVYAHHPPYSEFWTDYYGDEGVQEHLLPLFEEYNVDMVMNGHTHSYERGEKNHVHYLVSGGGGGGLDDFFVDYDHITFSAGEHHFTRIDVDGDQLLQTAINQDGAVVDQFTIHKFANVATESDAELPTTSTLGQNYPNPTNGRTTIPYSLAEPSRVQIALFSPTGQSLGTLLERQQAAGSYSVSLDTTWLSAGAYNLRFQAGDIVATQTITVLR